MGLEKITMPQLGESVTEGTISTWLVAPGSKVNKYDPIAEVITDKVTAEIPSSFSGTIKELIAKEGETLAVGKEICTIETEEDHSLVETRLDSEEMKDTEGPVLEENHAGKQRYSPAVLKLAQEHNIDLSKITGSGREGRITRKDILAFIAEGSNQNGQNTEKMVETIPVRESLVTPAPSSSTVVKAIVDDYAQANSISNEHISSSLDLEIPVTPIRNAIANNMVRSKQEIPHAWLMVEVDVTDLVSYRDSIKTEFKKKEGFNLTYFAFFVKAVAQSLKEFPQINSMWAGDRIIQKKDIHISIAVATEDALFVPVIKHADEKSIKGIAREISELAEKVRTKRLRQEDITGGTFTVNNTGSFGSVQSMGIINYPQAAILQVESIVKRPVVMENGMLAIRDMVNLCLSLDHRVLDGLICGKFLKHIKQILEHPSKEIY